MLPRGQNFARKAIALAATQNVREALAFATAHWGSASQVVSEMKTAVAAGTTGDADYAALVGTAESEAEFLELVDQQSIFGRLQGMRMVPTGVPICLVTGGATAYWVSASKGTPTSRQAFDRSSMFALRIGAITVFSNELARSASPQAEQVFRRDLIRAAVELTDLSFIDPGNAGVSEKSPASITFGADTVASTGDVADDVEAVLEAFAGSLLTASWVCHPRLAAQIGIRSGGRGIGCDLGARGGQLAGLPAITSEAVPYASDGAILCLIDAAGIAAVDQGFDVQRSTQAMIEMSDAPQGATDTPVAASSYSVSLFQSESTAVRISRAINFQRARDGAVVVLTGAGYPAAS